MEKVMYILWRDPAVDVATFVHNLRNDIADKLLHAGVHGLQVNAVDEGVASAERIFWRNLDPQMEAVLHVWVDCGMPRYLKPIDDIVAQGCHHFWAYLVTEAVLRNNVDPVPLNTRSPGLAQMGFGLKPKNLDIDYYFEKASDYMPIALRCQSLFYLQENFVRRVLTPGARPYASIVEEHFPAEAMTDEYIFFDAATGDDEKMDRNKAEIYAGIKAFVEFDTVDVIPTSRYIIKRPSFT
jgi:hypothetical protein